MSIIPNSNLPPAEKPVDSSSKAKKFFNSYYEESIAVSADSLDATLDFFRKRGFEDSAASMIATILLSQAKIENVPVFKILDTMKGLSDLQFSQVVKEILNYKRLRISTLATKVDNSDLFDYEKRNIIV